MVSSVSTSPAANRKTGGFSLTEMLVTLLILVLASTLMATGIPAAIDVYHKIVKTSNAQLALSTTLAAMRAEIGMASDARVLTVDEKDKIYYYIPNEGCWASIQNSETYRGLEKQYYKGMPTASVSLEDLTPDGSSMPLMSDEAITESLEVNLTPIPATSDKAGVDLRLSVIDSISADKNVLASVGEGENTFRILTRFTE
ncbi:MAG: type II secretion system protein [Atopobiaceae bacterium]|nr:type II secretion system protein [Atopobiaceae bacterium]